MKNKFSKSQKIAILIIGICISAFFLNQFVENYRGTWIYQYGSPLLLFVFYGGIIWSLINTFQMISECKSSLMKNLVWILISALPFLYIVIMMIKIFFTNV